jgi:uncharacterized protein
MVTLHFLADLNDFLQENQRDKDIQYDLDKPRSVKDLIESFGVPHTEINIIIANDQSVDFNYPVRPEDNIQVYPAFQQPDVSPITQLQSVPHEPRFILDVHLGKLAAYMRMMGFDTLYRNDYDDPHLASISANEDRILLTCDVRLLMRKEIDYGYFVRSRIPKQQFIEVMERFQLKDRYQPFSRCIECNGFIQPVDKEDITSQLQAKTRQYYNDFYQCQNCHKIYWEGNHVMQMQTVIKELINK